MGTHDPARCSRAASRCVAADRRRDALGVWTRAGGFRSLATRITSLLELDPRDDRRDRALGAARARRRRRRGAAQLPGGRRRRRADRLGRRTRCRRGLARLRHDEQSAGRRNDAAGRGPAPGRSSRAGGVRSLRRSRRVSASMRSPNLAFRAPRLQRRSFAGRARKRTPPRRPRHCAATSAPAVSRGLPSVRIVRRRPGPISAVCDTCSKRPSRGLRACRGSRCFHGRAARPSPVSSSATPRTPPRARDRSSPGSARSTRQRSRAALRA